MEVAEPASDIAVDPGVTDQTATTYPTDQSPVNALQLAVHNDGFEGAYYSGAAQCSTCYDGLIDPAGNDVSIVREWSTSMMANAGRDPYWIAKVAAEMHRNPALQDELGNTCT